MRVGVVGTGRIGGLHAETLVHHPAVTSVVVCDAQADAAHTLAERLDVTVSDSIDRLLAEVDAVVIAAATEAHPMLLGRSVDAGLPTFCEKPLAGDLAAAAEIATTVADSGVAVQMGFQRRFDRGFRATADLVARGDLGRLYLMRTTTNDPAPPPADYVARSGGFFADTLIHDFDLVRFVSGRDVVRVCAHGQVLVDDVFARHDDVDTAVAVLDLDGGGLAVATGTRHDPIGHDVRLEAFGSRDSVTAGLDARTPLRRLPDGPSSTRPYQDFHDRFGPAYRDELHAFVDVAAGGHTSPCTVGDALAAQRIAAACDRSWREGRHVRLEELE